MYLGEGKIKHKEKEFGRGAVIDYSYLAYGGLFFHFVVPG